ncbi:hypothetical protein VZP55_34990 [Myxococcus faecalis]
MALNERAQRMPQGRDIQRALQSQRRGQVVRRSAGLELIQEPQALLRERQRNRTRPRDRRQLRRAVGFPLRQRSEPLREQLYCRRLEEVPQRQRDARGGAQLRNQPRSQQRVSTQLEEVVGGTDLLDPEDRGEQGRKQLLRRRARRDELPRDRDEVRRGERLAVHLAAGAQRECVEEDERGRHHVLGQALGERIPESRGVL